MVARPDVRQAATAALAIAVIGALLVFSDATRAFERPISDWLIRIASQHPPRPAADAPQVTIVAIDAHSLRKYPDWTRSRALHAEVVERLSRAGARVIAFDVDFSASRDPASDALFRDAVRRSGRVVLAAFRQLAPVSPDMDRFEAANLLLPEFANVAAAVGSVLMPLDSDGVVRRATHANWIGDRLIEALPETAWSVAMGAPSDGRATESFRIDYRRVAPSIPIVALADVLDGRLEPAVISDRVVFVGNTANQLHDRWSTPLDPAESGVFIQALAFRTLAAERTGESVLTTPEKWVRIVFVALLSLVGALLSTIPHRLRLTSIAGVASFVVAAAIGLLVFWGILVEVVTPLVVLGLHYAVGVENLRRSFGERTRQGEVSLATIAEIDRAILSVIDRSHIIETLMRRVPEIYPCDAVSVTLLESAGGSEFETHVCLVGTGAQRTERCPLSSRHLEELRANPRTMMLGDDQLLPPYPVPLADERMRSFVVLPILFKSDLLGILALGDSRPMHFRSEDFNHARQVADQVGVALSNVRMFEQVRFLAYYDGLTELPNRALFHDRLSQSLIEASRSDRSLAVLLLDLDHFKRVNDTLGHGVGDDLLRRVASRIQECVRATDTVSRGAGAEAAPEIARLGGDEFTILLPRFRDEQDAARVATRLLKALGEKFSLGFHEVIVTGSIGISLYPHDGEDAETLLKNADAAMYHAKQEGRGNFQFYNESMNATALYRLTLESRLRGALDRGEFLLNYQPVVDMDTRGMVGVEALVRWNDPDAGIVRPDEFIPIAEESGLILSLGEWVLQRACSQARKWDAAGLPPIRVAVNVSGRQFRDESLVTTVRQVLDDTGLDPGRLVLEITEGVLMEASRETRTMLEELKNLGLRISIDDFGTGYSSLSYLTHFPLDSLKVDKSFVQGVDQNSDGAAITSAIVAMAHRLRLKVVAEGVETPQELAFLGEEGCDEIQGYLFSKPVAPESITQYLREGKRLEA
jgi:diguanylate cyclase (GGDEF)-like protein